MVADDAQGRSARPVVSRRKQPAGKTPDSKHREIVAGDEFAHQRVWKRRCAGPADTQRHSIRLCRGHLGELGRVIAQLLVDGAGEDRETGLVPRDDAACVAIAQPVKLLRIGYRKGLQHYRVDQGKDSGVAADAERQREDCYGGEPRALAKPA